jgi:hypothetical protein
MRKTRASQRTVIVETLNPGSHYGSGELADSLAGLAAAISCF